MAHNSCCVVNCKNTGRNSNCKFYTFPTASWKLEQRKRWINAVKRKTVDGKPWTPKPTDTICSDHFIGGKKSAEETSPSYIPTIFPSVYKKSKINETTALRRHTRFLNRRIAKQNITVSTITNSTKTTPENNVIIMNYAVNCTAVQNQKVDKDCQVDFFPNSNEVGKTFICNRCMYLNAEKCDAEIQTEIIDVKVELIEKI